MSLVCEKRGVYPRKALTIMRAWAVLFAFVGIQLAWNLRPFLGDRSETFRIIGSYQGNFYAAVLYATKQLLSGDQSPAPPGRTAEPSPRSQLLPFDTVAETARPRRP